ncbi:MAG: HAD-IA family hydrolase [Candidatus Binatia bacterium]
MASGSAAGETRAGAVRAVLFDAVGTLIRLREPVGETYARLAGVGEPAAIGSAFANLLRARSAMVFTDRRAAAVRAVEREWWEGLVRDVFAATGVALPDGAFPALWAHYASAAAWQAAPGAHALLETLRAAGLRTGVVSNFDHRLPAVLEALALAPLLEDVVLPADAGAAKPDSRIFALALSRLGVRAEETVYVGDDAREDVAAAQAAGMRAVDVRTLADLTELTARLAVA